MRRHKLDRFVGCFEDWLDERSRSGSSSPVFIGENCGPPLPGSGKKDRQKRRIIYGRCLREIGESQKLNHFEGSDTVFEAAGPVLKKHAAYSPHFSETGLKGESGDLHFLLCLLGGIVGHICQDSAQITSGEFAAFFGDGVSQRFRSVSLTLFSLEEIVVRLQQD